MSTNPFMQPVTSSLNSLLVGVDLQPIISVGNEEYSVTNPDGSISIQKKYTSIVLVDDTTWNLLQALRANDPILLAVCRTCRRGVTARKHYEPPTHGLLQAANARRCEGDCAETCCPRHSRLCSDGKVRCLVCARRYNRWAWVRGLQAAICALFWKEVDEDQ
jgi:hypothetical protein